MSRSGRRRIGAALRVLFAGTLIGSGIVVAEGVASSQEDAGSPTAYFIADSAVRTTAGEPALFSVDLSTGAASEIGLLGGAAQCLSFGALAFTPDGSTLYALSQSLDFGDSDPPLVCQPEEEPAATETALVSHHGASAAQIEPPPNGLEFDPLQLFTVDTSTGHAALVGTLATEVEVDGGGTELVDLAGIFNGLTVTGDGTMLLSGFVLRTNTEPTTADITPGFEGIYEVDVAAEDNEKIPVVDLNPETGFVTTDLDTGDDTTYGVSIDRTAAEEDVSTQLARHGKSVAAPRQDPPPPVPMLLSTVDPATGDVTVVGDLGGPFVLVRGDDGFNFPHIAFDDATGILWLVAERGGGIYTVDLESGDSDATGDAVSLDEIPMDVPNLAIRPQLPPPTTTTTTTTTTTPTPTTAPPAQPATPVKATPTLTG